MKNIPLMETVALLALSAFFLIMTTRFEGALSSASEGVQPSTVPRIALIIIIVATLLQAGLQFIRQRRTTAAREHAKTSLSWPIVSTILVCGAYIAAAYWLGFFIPMPFFCVALAVLWGATSLPRLAIYGIGCTAANWIVFIALFKSDLPMGILGN